MPLDDDGVLLERRIYINGLYDLYAPLLTERQRNVYEMRCFSDLSFGEIAETLNITRQAAHILAGRTAERLLTFERELGFAARTERLESRLKELEEELKEALEAKEREPRTGGKG